MFRQGELEMVGVIPEQHVQLTFAEAGEVQQNARGRQYTEFAKHRFDPCRIS